MSPRLQLSAVHKAFDGVPVVRGVSLTLAAGEVLCLLGPSGCGKSTTLRIAAGLERADAGEVRIEGELADGPGRFVPPERRRAGLMFQDFALFPHLSVRDNVAFGLMGLSRAERRRIAEDELAKVGLSSHLAAFPQELSGGQQQRVALARALAPRPRVMLMDEPFSGLDERLRDHVRDETMASLKARDTATLIVTHAPEEAMRISDRIALMRAGQIVQTGRPEEIYDHPVDAEAASFFSELNIVHATVAGGAAATPFGSVGAPGHRDGTRVEVMLRPQFLHVGAAHGAPLAGRVRQSRLLGDDSLVEVDVVCPEASEAGEPLLLKARVHGRMLPPPGTEIGLAAELGRVFVFPCARQPGQSAPPR